MELHKSLKIALGCTLGVFTFLFIVLVVHIATAKPVELDNATYQISRIDFKEPLDSLKMKEIRRNLKSIPGVKNDRFNLENGVVVFYHDNRIVDAEGVFNQLQAKGNYNAERFTISDEIASKKVCPVMNTNSFSYKFSRGIQRIFN